MEMLKVLSVEGLQHCMEVRDRLWWWFPFLTGGPEGNQHNSLLGRSTLGC